MPVVVTFDIAGAPPADHNRIQSFFERFGWQNLGGSSYRYPKLGTDDQPVEDWLNHIVPAMMLFRTYLIDSATPLTKFTLDVQSSSGFDPNAPFGNAPSNDTDPNVVGIGGGLKLYDPNNVQFGRQNLIDWLNGINWPY